MLRAATTLSAAPAGTANRGQGGALTHGRPERATLLAFIGAVVIGGGNFVAVRFSNEKLPPLFGAPLRFGAAAVILFRIARARRVSLPRGRAASGAALYGLLGSGLAYAFIYLYLALVGLAAGTTSVILAPVPLLTLALSVLHGQEWLAGRGIVGGLRAIGGSSHLPVSVWSEAPRVPAGR